MFGCGSYKHISLSVWGITYKLKGLWYRDRLCKTEKKKQEVKKTLEKQFQSLTYF